MKKYREHSELVVEMLQDPRRAEEYLDVALEEYGSDGDLGALLLALRRVAEAQGGLGKLAREADLNRANLYEALSDTGHPKFETVGTILHSLGFRLSVERLTRAK